MFQDFSAWKLPFYICFYSIHKILCAFLSLTKKDFTEEYIDSYKQYFFSKVKKLIMLQVSGYYIIHSTISSFIFLSTEVLTRRFRTF